jgi:hypothetical protein
MYCPARRWQRPKSRRRASCLAEEPWAWTSRSERYRLQINEEWGVAVDGPMRADSRLPWWQSWLRFWGWVASGALVAIFVTAVFVEGFTVIFLAMPGALAMAFGGVEMIGPRRFLNWRAADAPARGSKQQVGVDFDAALGVERGEDGDFTAAAVRRVRAMGAGVFIFGWLAVAAAVFAERGGHL